MGRIGTVAGWDGSAAADGALAWAAEHESRAGGALHLLRVLGLEGGAEPVERVAAAREALSAATTAVQDRHPGLEVVPELSVGDPIRELARAAGGDRLLVLGASAVGRARRSGSRRIPIALAARQEGTTAVVPIGLRPPGGVVAVVSAREHSRPTIDFAVAAAAERGEPLTILRLHDPHDLELDPPGALLAAEVDRIRDRAPSVDVRVARGWVSTPYGLLSRSDAASLLVLEGARPSAAPPRYSFERLLAGQARAPFVVVARPSPPVATTVAAAKLALAV
ncbi:hypothetical protein [Amnibacterium kyonggiense]|uniref:Universal stress protein family protein n=1 Tax=Amnibacterium kyonggiense TaxID=595671 RepID=A0A4R7FKI4_9MICO|nr:hypothetical protein [Amnibacterium kyonggiense]TDS76857.1 universal stress protein family protein [Amnibacterium kyonggiense]